MTAPTIGAQSAPPQLVMDRCARNSYYRAAVETPELIDAIELRARALRMRAEIPNVPPVPMPTTADADLAAWLDLDKAQRHAAQDRAEAADAFSRLIAVQDQRISSIANNQNSALARLNQAMQGVMSIAAQLVSRLSGCHTATQIVANGDPDVLAAFQDLRRLRSDEYDAIRTAQDWCMAGDPRGPNYRSKWLDDDLASDTAIANLDEVFPQWRERKPEFAIISASDQPQADPRPWPTDPTEQIIWLVTSDAQVWVPTWHQLGELGRRRIAERAHTSGTSRRPKQRQQRVTPGNHTSELLNQRIGEPA